RNLLSTSAMHIVARSCGGVRLMLTNEDIQFIKDTREEVVENRQKEIVVEYRTEGVRNPITGVVESGTGEQTLPSVVTDRTSRVAAERRISDQAEIVEGDIWFSISDTVLQTYGINAKDIVYATHNGDRYAVVAEDPKGIGEYNRHEFVGKKVV